MVVFAKGLANGVPIGGVIATAESPRATAIPYAAATIADIVEREAREAGAAMYYI